MGTDYCNHLIIGIPFEKVAKQGSWEEEHKEFNSTTGRPLSVRKYNRNMVIFNGKEYRYMSYVNDDPPEDLVEELEKLGLKLVSGFLGVEPSKKMSHSCNDGRVVGSSNITCDEIISAFEKAKKILKDQFDINPNEISANIATFVSY